MLIIDSQSYDIGKMDMKYSLGKEMQVRKRGCFLPVAGFCYPDCTVSSASTVPNLTSDPLASSLVLSARKSGRVASSVAVSVSVRVQSLTGALKSHLNLLFHRN